MSRNGWEILLNFLTGNSWNEQESCLFSFNPSPISSCYHTQLQTLKLPEKWRENEIKLPSTLGKFTMFFIRLTHPWYHPHRRQRKYNYQFFTRFKSGKMWNSLQSGFTAALNFFLLHVKFNSFERREGNSQFSRGGKEKALEWKIIACWWYFSAPFQKQQQRWETTATQKISWYFRISSHCSVFFCRWKACFLSPFSVLFPARFASDNTHWEKKNTIQGW